MSVYAILRDTVSHFCRRQIDDCGFFDSLKRPETAVFFSKSVEIALFKMLLYFFVANAMQ